MESDKWLKFWLIFLIIYVTYWYLIVLVHETGHLIIGFAFGGQFHEFVVNFPYYFGALSYVSMTVPAYAITVFRIGGTLFTISLGVILTLLPTIYPKVMGWLLMIDGIVYPLSSSFTHVGDFAMVDFFYTPLFIAITMACYIVSIMYYRKKKREKREQ